jgi:hypothetical protein
MKAILKRIGMGTVVALVLTGPGKLLATDEVDFETGLGFSSSGPPFLTVGDGSIVSSTLSPLLISGGVSIGNAPFAIGAVTTSGNVTEAPLTGTASFMLSDFFFAGTLEGKLSLTEIEETPGAVGYNYLIVGTITDLQDFGTDQALGVLLDQGSLSLTLTAYDSPVSLPTLLANPISGIGAPVIAGINGAMVPDSATTLALLAGTGSALGFLRRIRGTKSRSRPSRDNSVGREVIAKQIFVQDEE